MQIAVLVRFLFNRQLLSSLKLNLLQNAIETQKLLSVIHERESTIASNDLPEIIPGFTYMYIKYNSGQVMPS